MRSVWRALRSGVCCFWRGLREWSGDAAYENYQKSVERKGVTNPLSPAAFYLQQVNRKYSRPNRCC